MIVTVKAHEIFIVKDELVNEKEVNISNCKFKFDDEITDDFVKIAIFTKGSKSYSQVIINNECNYPAEILESTGDCILGVVMTLSSDDRIIKRYSPIPKRFWISSGSLRTAINSEEVTASEFEQYMQALQDQLGKINDLQQNVVEQGDYAKEQGDYAKEQGDYAKEQGDYAKEQANNIIKANVEASEIIDKFKSNVNEYTTAFDNNASEKLKSYNDNFVAKTSKFNDNYDNKVSQFNDNAVNKINEYNSNAKQKIAEYNKHSEELGKKIVSTRNELERVKNDILETGTASDSFINVQDSALAELQELSVEMNKDNVQATTSGINVLNTSGLETGTDHGITYTPVYKNGQLQYINVDGTSTADVSYAVHKTLRTLINEEKSYFASGCPSGGDSTTYSIINYYYDENNIYLGGVYDTGSGVVIPKSAMILSMILIKSGVTLNNAKFYPMLIEGAEKKAYEPYTGGIASPNMGFPQDINVLTGSQKVTSCNKNMFNKTDCVDCKALDDNGNLIDNADYSTSNYRIINSNTFMTISGMDWGRIGLYDETKKFISLTVNHNTRDVSFAVPKNARYYRLSSTTESLNNVQLEEKSTSSSFENHQEMNVIFDIPTDEFVSYIDETYKDELDIVYNEIDGKWHKILKKKLNKYQFSGNENFSLNATTSNYTEFMAYIAGLNASQYNITKSNGFLYTIDNRIAISSTDAVYIRVPASLKIDTVDKFKAIIASIYVYYVLATPYDIDLGTVDMPLSYNEITNIFTDSDLLPTINAKYYRNFTKTIQNLQVNETALKQELININNRLSALESAKASVIDDSPSTEESEVAY